MPEDWQNKNITVKSFQEFETPNGNKGTSVKDEKGDEYTIWHLKQDGSFSKAFQKFQGTKIDDVIEINYEEKPGKKEGFVNRTIRTVRRVQKDGNYSIEAPGKDWVEIDSAPF